MKLSYLHFTFAWEITEFSVSHLGTQSKFKPSALSKQMLVRLKSINLPNLFDLTLTLTIADTPVFFFTLCTLRFLSLLQIKSWETSECNNGSGES